MAFLPNPNNFPCINHKDEDKKNNNVDNLEWCSYAYNVNYGDYATCKIEKFGHKICMYNKQGKFIRTFASSHQASDIMGIHRGSITDCCKRRSQTAGGYVWRYKHETKENDIEPICTLYKNSPKTVWQYDKSKRLIAVYKSIHEAARETGVKPENIGACCRGIGKTAGGFFWTYEGCPIPRPKRLIVKYDLNMNRIASYEDLSSACRLIGGDSKKAGVKQCLYGKNKSAYGFIWRYEP